VSSRSFFFRRRILICGGLGFIGSNLARRLADLGGQVCVVDALLAHCGGNRANIVGYEDRIDLRIFDLGDRVELDKVVEGQEIIFNVAGRVSHLDSMIHPVQDMEANVLATIHLLEACRAHAADARVVFASTRQIYGKPRSLPVAEDHALSPVDVNGVNKMAAEAFHTLYCSVYGMRTISLRLTNTFGPRMRVKDARQTFLGVWLRNIVERRPFEVWGGEQLRDFSYIDDAVEACLDAAEASQGWGGAYNVGGSPPVSLIALAEMLKELDAGASYERREFPPERKIIDIGDYYADDRKFRTLTGWSPRVSLEDGLRRSLAYYHEFLPAYV
jgi:UDP-glucose 4-epimerase